MDYLGLLCLGAFVGSIAALGVRYIKSIDQWEKVLAAVLPAVLSGVALAFVERFKESAALGCYPLGLVLAMLWTYADVAVENAASANSRLALIGWGHIAACVVASLAALTLALIPAMLQLRDISRLEPAARLAVLSNRQPASQPPAVKPDGGLVTAASR